MKDQASCAFLTSSLLTTKGGFDSQPLQCDEFLPIMPNGNDWMNLFQGYTPKNQEGKWKQNSSFPRPLLVKNSLFP